MTNKETKTARERAEEIALKIAKDHCREIEEDLENQDFFPPWSCARLKRIITKALEQAQQREPWPSFREFMDNFACEGKTHREIYDYLKEHAAPTVEHVAVAPVEAGDCVAVVPSDEVILEMVMGKMQKRHMNCSPINCYGKEASLIAYKAALQSTQTISAADIQKVREALEEAHRLVGMAIKAHYDCKFIGESEVEKSREVGVLGEFEQALALLEPKETTC